MSDKTAKAMFKLRCLLTDTGIEPKTAIKLFDQLIKPIALYGSEIWGPGKLSASLQNKQMLNKSFSKMSCEKVNLSFCRSILGVHKKAQNSAVLGELGRYPLGLDVAANAILYLKHLLSGKANRLLVDALLCDTSLPERVAWTHRVNRLEQYIFHGKSSNHRTRHSINRILQDEYKTYWLGLIRSERKMRTYITFKSHFTMENYLSLLPLEHRRCFSRFRISAHKLAIERGRYTRPPTPVEKRTCPHCPDKVEDELHVLTQCHELSAQRACLFTNILTHCPQFRHLDEQGKLIYMMSAQGESLRLVANFILTHIKC